MAVRPLYSFQAHSAICPQTNSYPIFQSTSRRAIAFSDTLDWSYVDSGVMPASYSGGSVTVRIYWASWTVTTGNCRLSVEFERMASNGNATTSSTFGTLVATNDPAASTLAAMKYLDITLTAANMGTIVAGEAFRIRIGRVGSNGGDTLVGLAYVYLVYLQEV